VAIYLKNALMSADQIAEQKSKSFRAIPTVEHAWWREGHLVRIKLSQVDPGLPEGLSALAVKRWRLVHFDGQTWHELPLHIDLADGFDRWTGPATAGFDTALWFYAPATGVCTDERWPAAAADDVMVPLMLCSIVGLAIIADRWLYLRRTAREIYVTLERIDRMSEHKDIEGIESFCNAHSCLLLDIFLAGARKFHQLEDEPNLDFVQHEITKVMEDASITNTNDLERRLPLLGSVGNVAPLFGFAGTVTGMIHAFERIAATANPNAQVVAAGIEEALVTTAAGLVIAIPAVLFYNYFTNQIDALNARTEESANGLLDSLVMILVERRKQARKNADS